MFRLFLVSLSLVILFADVDVDISANKIIRSKDKVTLEGNTTAKLLGYKLGSEKAVVNTKENVFNLRENVFLEKDDIFINSDDITIRLNDENISLNGFKLQDKKSKLWVKSNEANICKGVYAIQKSTLSSCNDDPSWKITFSNGEYSEKENNFYLHDAVLKIHDVPVLYTPYLSVSNKVRKSGLLTPEFSISSSEVGYMQPYYINISKSQDLELTSHLRTKKGLGLNSIYRWASSKNSLTNIQLIYFNHDKDYADKFNIEKKDIYGLELEHSINIQDEGYSKQKLFIDLRKANYNNYESFKKVNLSGSSIIKKTTSKIGYVNTNKDWYFDIFVKQYDDVNTKEISQKLPQINIHKNIDNFFLDNLYYAIDVKSQNLYRKNRGSLLANRASLQFIYDTYLINNYLNFSLYNNTFYSFDNFYLNEISIDNEYTKVYHKAKLSTDLMGKYKGFTHNIKADINYLVLDYKAGLPLAYSIYDSEIKKTEKLELKSKIEVNIKNSFYNKHNKVFHHKITGNIDYINQGASKKDTQEKNLFNKVAFNVSHDISFENKVDYSFEDSKIYKVLSSLEYKKKDTLKLNHIYDSRDSYKSDYLRLNSKKKLTKEYSLSLDIDFDNNLNNVNRWGVGLEKNEDCFGYNIKLSKDNSSANPTDETIFSFKVNLKPLGGFSQNL